MVAPVRIHNTVIRRSGLRPLPWNPGYKIVVFEKRVFGYVQKRPYTIDTPVITDWKINQQGYDDADAWAVTPNDPWIPRDAAANQARSRFVASLGDSSSFGATLTAEAKQTLAMVNEGAFRFVKAGRLFLRGRIPEGLSLLNFSPPTKIVRSVVSYPRKNGKGRKKKRITRAMWVMPDGRQIAKSAANKWLLFSYGVKPLAQDLYNGLDILQRPLPVFSVKRGSSKLWSSQVVIDPRPSSREVYISKVVVKVKAEVSVVNPNLWLANQMGLVNPLQWVNEAVPFSFVLDWFSNWSDCIMQFTDFAGLNIEKPITTIVTQIRHTRADPGLEASVRDWVRFERALSIPDAKLRFAYERFSWQRGANAISLLIGMLPRH